MHCRCLGLRKTAWGCMKLNRATWGCMGPHGTAWAMPWGCMGRCGGRGDRMGCSGFKPIPPCVLPSVTPFWGEGGEAATD